MPGRIVNRLLLCAFLSSLICLATLLLAGAGNNIQRLTPGTLLVASDKLGDPNFAETVILITRRDENEGTLGLVLNRQADITLAKAFPKLHANADPVYEGGPVSPDAVQGLLRSGSKPDDAEQVVGSIYSVVHKALLEKSISSHLAAAKFRVYLGYAGWGPGQLENEIRQGAWTTAYGTQYVFDSEPDSLWDRLNRDTQSQLAQAANPLSAHATMKACRYFAQPLWPSSLLFAPPPSPLRFWCYASKTTPNFPI
jgi:putative transcriptional regulator